MTACDASFFSLGVTILFSQPFLPLSFCRGGRGGTCCSDHKMPEVACTVKNYHVCLDLAPV